MARGFDPGASVTILDALARGDLAGSRELRLNGLGLTAFPRELFALTETLEVLDLGDNALSALPDDMGRFIKLRALFCSGNPFERLPPSLGACTVLSQIGFRRCGLREVPGEALPPALRWLTLTENRLEHLPAELGRCPELQKLMLAGNRLEALPESLAGASRLELIRISANRFEALPSWLLDLPRLAWLACAGNPYETRSAAASPLVVRWSELRIGALLGEGASGRVHDAHWETGSQRLALKLFKGTMTSDGLPECEMAACLAAGPHPNLVGGLGRLADHPEDLSGLLMPLVPESWRVLAGPPSLLSCSRDVYDPTLRLPLTVALTIARDIGRATVHLHARGLSHGDLYAHNVLWDGADGVARLSDFGAAAFMPSTQAPAMERLDVLAWGILLGELLDRSDAESAQAWTVQCACVGSDAGARPRMAEALDHLERLS
jgi:hypothetical protein